MRFGFLDLETNLVLDLETNLVLDLETNLVLDLETNLVLVTGDLFVLGIYCTGKCGRLDAPSFSLDPLFVECDLVYFILILYL